MKLIGVIDDVTVEVPDTQFTHEDTTEQNMATLKNIIVCNMFVQDRLINSLHVFRVAQEKEIDKNF